MATKTVARYYVAFRRRTNDPWQEAEPALPARERYMTTAEEAEEAAEFLRDYDDRAEYRVVEIEIEMPNDEIQGLDSDPDSRLRDGG